MRFSKMHGAGNDFVVLDLRHGVAPPDAALCRQLADRHIGIGCDQILTVEPPRSPDAIAAYGVWNADGTLSGQCGNGARCIAAWLLRDGAAPAGEPFLIDSPRGTHEVQGNADGSFLIDMGMPRFAPAMIPLLGFDEADRYALEVDGQTIAFGAVSLSNPHAVIECTDVAGADVAGIGAAMQAHAAFPESVNVGFAQVLDPSHIRLRVFERGAGETRACGSGACAAVAVLARWGRVADAGVRVDLPGGRLTIRHDRQGAILMGGPAAFVFDGIWQGAVA